MLEDRAGCARISSACAIGERERARVFVARDVGEGEAEGERAAPRTAGSVRTVGERDTRLTTDAERERDRERAAEAERPRLAERDADAGDDDRRRLDELGRGVGIVTSAKYFFYRSLLESRRSAPPGPPRAAQGRSRGARRQIKSTPLFSPAVCPETTPTS